MQLLPRLVLNRMWIVLQAIHMPLQSLALLLELLQLFSQRTRLLPLLLVHRQPIGAEDHVVGKATRQQCHRTSHYFAAPGVQDAKPRSDRRSSHRSLIR